MNAWLTIAAMTISSGTARNAPSGPHIHAHNAIERNTAKGLISRCLPKMVGVINCPSTVTIAVNSKGATAASTSDG